MSSARPQYLLDVNTIAIAMVEEHPGHDHVYAELMQNSVDRVVYHPYTLLRAYWVLTSEWDYNTADSRRVVRRFLMHFRETVSSDWQTVKLSFDLAVKWNHDVFDCFFIALCRQHDLDGVMSTDRDFSELCRRDGLDWVNPVPEDVIAEFSEFDPL